MHYLVDNNPINMRKNNMGYLDDYFEDDNSYYGVCLNCGSGKCGHHGGCTDRETDTNIKNEVTENGE